MKGIKKQRHSEAFSQIWLLTEQSTGTTSRRKYVYWMNQSKPENISFETFTKNSLLTLIAEMLKYPTLEVFDPIQLLRIIISQSILEFCG